MKDEGMTASLGADHPSAAGFLLSMTCLIIFQCQEKPVDESFTPVLAHARYRLHGLHVVSHGLALDESHV
jgi:hypothetical protein